MSHTIRLVDLDLAKEERRLRDILKKTVASTEEACNESKEKDNLSSERRGSRMTDEERRESEMWEQKVDNTKEAGDDSRDEKNLSTESRWEEMWDLSYENGWSEISENENGISSTETRGERCECRRIPKRGTWKNKTCQRTNNELQEKDLEKKQYGEAQSSRPIDLSLKCQEPPKMFVPIRYDSQFTTPCQIAMYLVQKRYAKLEPILTEYAKKNDDFLVRNSARIITASHFCMEKIYSVIRNGDVTFVNKREMRKLRSMSQNIYEHLGAIFYAQGTLKSDKDNSFICEMLRCFLSLSPLEMSKSHRVGLTQIGLLVDTALQKSCKGFLAECMDMGPYDTCYRYVIRHNSYLLQVQTLMIPCWHYF